MLLIITWLNENLIVSIDQILFMIGINTYL